jgi:hypothetical protein
MGIHFRERLRSLSVRSRNVSLVAWTCSYQPIAFKLTHYPILLSLSEVNLPDRIRNPLSSRWSAGERTPRATCNGRQ